MLIIAIFHINKIYRRVVRKLTKDWNMITTPTKDDINVSIFNKVWSFKNNEWILNPKEINIGSAFWIKE